MRKMIHRSDETSTVKEHEIEEGTEGGDEVVSEEQVKDKVPVSINEDHNMEEIEEAPIEATSNEMSKNDTTREVLIEDIIEEVSQEEGVRQITIEAEVMHRDCSQVDKKDPENTETASEGEEVEGSRDSGITPAQRINEEKINEEMDIENEEFGLQLTPSTQLDPQLGASSSQVGPPGSVQIGVKRNVSQVNDPQSGTEEDPENTVKLEAGSLVNSFWNKARKKLKDKAFNL